MSSWWIDVEDSSGTRLGDGPLRAVRWRSTGKLNGAGSFEFEIPAEDVRAASLLQQKRVVRCKAVVGGQVREIGAGTIEGINLRVSGDGATRVVSGPDLLGELRRVLVDKRSTGYLSAFYNWPTFINDDEVPYKLLDDWANEKLASAWTLANEAGTTISSGVAVTQADLYARFRDETVLNALLQVAKTTGEYFRPGTGRKVEWIGPASDFTAAGVRAVYGVASTSMEGRSDVALIASIERMVDTAGLVNRIIVYGAGEGDTRLTLRAATEWPDGTGLTLSPESRTIDGRQYYLVRTSTSSAVDETNNCLQDQTSVAAYGVHEAVVQFRNIAPVSNTDADVTNATNQLVRAAIEWLKLYSEPLESYRLRLAQAPVILRPGQTLSVSARRYVDGNEAFDIDDTLNILESTVEIDVAGLRTSDVVVSTGTRAPASDTDVVVSQAAQAYASIAHPQLGPNVRELSVSADFDDAKFASLPFWFGNETAQIQQVLLRFRIDPLRSTVKSVAGSSTSSGASSTSSSGGGGATTTSSANSSGSISGTTGANLAAGDPHSHNYTLVPHTHDVTLSNHVHDISHTHTFTPSVATSYGIFEDSGGTVSAYNTILLYVNGVVISTGSMVYTGVSGWYQVDLTSSVVDADTGRPVQAANTISCIANTGQRGRLTAQLQIRSVIQSVAYL